MLSGVYTRVIWCVHVYAVRDTRSRIPIYIVCTQTRHEIDVARLQAPPSWPCARLECAVRSSLREVWVALLPRGRKDGVGLGRRHAKGGGVLDEADKEGGDARVDSLHDEVDEATAHL